MRESVPKCGIIKLVKIRPDGVVEVDDTGEFQFTEGTYQFIDKTSADYETLAADDSETGEHDLSRQEAQEVDQFYQTMEESSASLDEDTAPQWFQRSPPENKS